MKASKLPATVERSSLPRRVRRSQREVKVLAGAVDALAMFGLADTGRHIVRVCALDARIVEHVAPESIEALRWLGVRTPNDPHQRAPKGDVQ